MNVRKKWLRIWSAVLLSAGLLAGCGIGGTGETSGTGGGYQAEEASSPAGSGKPVKLEIIETGSGLPAPDQDIIKQELDKALNIELNLTVYASGDDYKNQLNVRMASGNFPDLFAVDRTSIKQFAEQGLLLDLTPYLDKLEQAAAYIGEDSLKKGTIDGKVYAIAKSPQIPYNTYWVRQDWLDKLNLQPPATIEELLAVAKAFTEQDPDGNGKKDTYGLTGGKLGAFAPVFGAFGVGMPGNFYVKDGELVNAFYDPGTKDALAFIKTMIEAGVVDPELLANTGLQHQQKAIKGQAGIVWLDWPNMTKEEYVNQIKAVNPNAAWIQIAPPIGPGGQYDGSWDIGGTPGMYAIPKSLEKEPEKLQKVFDLLNYVSDPEGGVLLVQYGVEGSHFNLEDGKVVPTELLSKEGAYFWLYQFTGRPEMEYLMVKFAQQAEYIEFANSQPRIQTLNGFVDNPDGYNAADANRYAEEELVKFIYGKRPLDEYDQFLNTLETSMNYKLYLDSAVEQLSALGYGK